MFDIDLKGLKRLGIKPPKPCPCGAGLYRLQLHDGETSRWVLATCKCHRQMIFSSTSRTWSLFEQVPCGLPDDAL